MQTKYSNYFDYNATTPLDESVFEAMSPYLRDHYGNPSSFYALGRQTTKAIRSARREIAYLLGGVDAGQIMFTSGGTESNNTAFHTALSSSDKNEIIISAVEHPSVRKLARCYEGKGYSVHEVPVDENGRFDFEFYQEKLSDKTALISVMAVNNETGVVFDIEKIGTLAKAVGALVHVDGVQALGKIKIDLSNSSIDFLSLSAHKIYGPKGVGALYIKPGLKVESFMIGGSQEYGWRAGTENVAGIVGFGHAAKMMHSLQDEEMLRVRSIRDAFEKEIKRVLSGVKIHAEAANRVMNTSNLYIAGVEAESLLIALDQESIFASKGSACTSGAQEPSYVLKAMGCSKAEIDGSLRISFGRYSTIEDVSCLAHKIKEVVLRTREMESV